MEGTTWRRTGLDRRQWRGLYLEQDRIGQTTVEGTDGGNYLEKDRIGQTTVEGYSLQSTDNTLKN